MTASFPMRHLATLLLVLVVPAVGEAEPLGAAGKLGQAALTTGMLPDENWPAAGPSPMLTPAQYCRYGVARLCATTYGACNLSGQLCVGDPCYCPSAYGPVWGVAR